MTMLNLLIIVVFNLFLYVFFYKLITKKWLPNRNTIIAIVIGILLVPIAIPIQKFIESIILSNELQIFAWASTEEILKLIPIILLLYFCKSRKFTFLEILGIGIGFSFLETILFGHGNINRGSTLYQGIPTTFSYALSVGFLTLILRSLGSLLLHTLTVGLMGLTIFYLKNKRKLFILITLPISICIHFWFNKNIMMNDGQDFLFVFSIIWLLFIFMFSSFIYIESRIKNLDKMKATIVKVAKFLLKYVIFLLLSLGLIFTISSFNLFGSQYYSVQEIEQAKKYQNELMETAKTWQSEELTNRYSESKSDVSRIREIFYEMDSNYSRIINVMEEENEELSLEDGEFLKSGGLPLSKELNKLTSKFNLESWKLDNIQMKKNAKDVLDFFGNKNLPHNIKSDYLKYNEISEYVITTDNSIIPKMELGQELSKEEIDYSEKERAVKVKELSEILDRLNQYAENN